MVIFEKQDLKVLTGELLFQGGIYSKDVNTIYDRCVAKMAKLKELLKYPECECLREEYNKYKNAIIKRDTLNKLKPC